MTSERYAPNLNSPLTMFKHFISQSETMDRFMRSIGTPTAAWQSRLLPKREHKEEFLEIDSGIMPTKSLI